MFKSDVFVFFRVYSKRPDIISLEDSDVLSVGVVISSDEINVESRDVDIPEIFSERDGFKDDFLKLVELKSVDILPVLTNRKLLGDFFSELALASITPDITTLDNCELLWVCVVLSMFENSCMLEFCSISRLCSDDTSVKSDLPMQADGSMVLCSVSFF